MKKRFSSLFFLILILTVIASGLVFWRLFFSPKKTVPTPTPILTPSPTPLPIPSPEVEKGKGESPEDLLRSLKEKFPLVESVPYQTEDFSIDYLAPLHLEVKLKRDSPEIRKKVLDWIWAKGVNPATHQINWLTRHQ